MPLTPRAQERIRREFFPANFTRAINLLSRWNVDDCTPGERPSRMHAAVLNIARGNYASLKRAKRMALIDYRDVLYWGDDPETKRSRYKVCAPAKDPSHPDEEAFLASIRRKPPDNAIRLVYADWLEERGDAQRAEYLRVLCGWIACRPAADKQLIVRERKLRRGLAPVWLARIRGIPVRERKRKEQRAKLRQGGGAKSGDLGDLGFASVPKPPGNPPRIS
jgi:uncharacterized protein (TIGR02996 family)